MTYAAPIPRAHYVTVPAADFERLKRQAAATRLHTIPDPMTARERAERADLAGENG